MAARNKLCLPSEDVQVGRGIGNTLIYGVAQINRWTAAALVPITR